MKNIFGSLKYLVMAGIAFAMVVNAGAQQANEATAKVVRIKGGARYATANNVWQPLKVGDILHSGAIIQTAEGGRVDLVLGDKEAVATERQWGEVMKYQPEADQNFVRVWENSVLAIDKLTVADTGADQITETQLDLRKGRIFGTVKKLSAASKYEIKIPNGVAGIRGTVYSISADGMLSVLSGAVVMAYTDGNGNVTTQVVVGGQEFDTHTGQFSPIPQTLRREMGGALGDSRFPHPGPPLHFPGDTTHHHMSPTRGHFGGGDTAD